MKAWQIVAVVALTLAIGGTAARAECEYHKSTKTSSLTAPSQVTTLA